MKLGSASDEIRYKILDDNGDVVELSNVRNSNDFIVVK